MFWGFLYNDTMVGLDLYMEINVHIFPIVVLSIDMIMNSYPYHLWMYVFPAIAGTVYLLINLTYSLS